MTDFTDAGRPAESGAIARETPKVRVPRSPQDAAPAAGGGRLPFDIHRLGAPAHQIAEGHWNSGAQAAFALGDACAALMELQVRRKAYLQHIGAAERRLGALGRRMLGWHGDMPEAESAAMCRRAAALVKAMERGRDHPDMALAAAAGLDVDVRVVRASLAPLVAARREIEREMERIAKGLPVAEFVAGVRGFSFRGVAVIVGEAGNLSDYPNPAKLWKRCGLAPYRGRAGSSWRMKGGLAADDWVEMGYSPARLGQIHGVVGEPLMKGNDGEYRAVYLAEKARFVAEGKAERPLHAHRHGMRLMVKALVLDLWRAWRGLPPRVRAMGLDG